VPVVCELVLLGRLLVWQTGRGGADKLTQNAVAGAPITAAPDYAGTEKYAGCDKTAGLPPPPWHVHLDLLANRKDFPTLSSATMSKLQ